MSHNPLEPEQVGKPHFAGGQEAIPAELKAALLGWKQLAGPTC